MTKSSYGYSAPEPGTEAHLRAQGMTQFDWVIGELDNAIGHLDWLKRNGHVKDAELSHHLGERLGYLKFRDLIIREIESYSDSRNAGRESR
jgi:hypothetical protein